jgi:hypothetical protein
MVATKKLGKPVLVSREPQNFWGIVLCSSGEQLRAGRREGDEGTGLVHLQPAALDRKFEARAVLGRAAAVTEEKRLVDFLDVDAALNRFDRVSDFEDSARGFFRVRLGAICGQFHEPRTHRFQCLVNGTA